MVDLDGCSAHTADFVDLLGRILVGQLFTNFVLTLLS